MRKMGRTAKGVLLLGALLLAAQSSGCAGSKKEARYPEREPEGIEVRCPYCKTVFRW